MSFTWGLKSPVQSRDSLIRRINSLMTRFNSLLGPNKFPVPMRRELARKPLNLMLDSEPVVALLGLGRAPTRKLAPRETEVRIPLPPAASPCNLYLAASTRSETALSRRRWQFPVAHAWAVRV